jgi:hypothetical protein
MRKNLWMHNSSPFAASMCCFVMRETKYYGFLDEGKKHLPFFSRKMKLSTIAVGDLFSNAMSQEQGNTKY